MQFRFKKYFAIITLIGFLFPLVTEAFHAYEHINERHCTDHSVAHMHNAEHHCYICDFTFSASDQPTIEIRCWKAPLLGGKNFAQYQCLLLTTCYRQLSLRGPPAFA